MRTLLRRLRSILSKARSYRLGINRTTMAQARKSTKTSAEAPLRILCFGNSLTCGYPIDNPYAVRLAQKIEEAFPGRKIEYEVEGMPGDLVTRGLYLDRMQRSCKCPRSRGRAAARNKLEITRAPRFQSPSSIFLFLLAGILDYSYCFLPRA
jgi:lysophospholipase L1-like esterase